MIHGYTKPCFLGDIYKCVAFKISVAIYVTGVHVMQISEEQCNAQQDDKQLFRGAL